MFNINLKKLSLSVILILLLGILLKRCDKHKLEDITDEKLKPGEKTAIIINNRGQVTEIDRGNVNRIGVGSPLLRGRNPQPTEVPPEVVKRTDGARDIRISIDDRGNVSYTYRTWGFEFSPEVGLCYASSHTGISVNDSFFFYRKHEVLVGLRFALSGSKEIRPYIGYAYSPKFKYLSNTSLVFGIDLDKAFVIGTSTKF